MSGSGFWGADALIAGWFGEDVQAAGWFDEEFLTSGTVWNSADKAANITLSNGNLRADGDGLGWGSVRGTTSHTSGKKYFEVTANSIVGGAATGVGVANSSAALSITYFGVDTNGISCFAFGGTFYNGATIQASASYTNGDVIGVAVDVGAGRIWFAKNGTWQSGDPAAGTGGIDISLMTTAPIFPGFSDANDGGMTANFGGSTFAQSVPSGFESWNTTTVVNNNLTGSTGFSFAASAAVSGLGALSGTAGVVFATSGSVLGRGNVSGASSFAFAPSAALVGRGNIAGSSAIAFAPSGSVSGRGALAGSSAFSFVPSGSVIGRGGISGSIAFALASSGSVLGRGPVSGSAGLSFAGSGAVSGVGAISGATTIQFVPSGLAGNAGGSGVTGSATLAFTCFGTLTDLHVVLRRVRMAKVIHIDRAASPRRPAYTASGSRGGRSATGRR